MLEIGTVFLSLECTKEVDKKFSVNHHLSDLSLFSSYQLAYLLEVSCDRCDFAEVPQYLL